jgi:hypothetical protein
MEIIGLINCVHKKSVSFFMGELYLSFVFKKYRYSPQSWELKRKTHMAAVKEWQRAGKGKKKGAVWQDFRFYIFVVFFHTNKNSFIMSFFLFCRETLQRMLKFSC